MLSPTHLSASLLLMQMLSSANCYPSFFHIRPPVSGGDDHMVPEPSRGLLRRRFVSMDSSPFDALLYAWQPRESASMRLLKRSVRAGEDVRNNMPKSPFMSHVWLLERQRIGRDKHYDGWSQTLGASIAHVPQRPQHFEDKRVPLIRFG